ncbi:MAG: hypothetical protein U5L11_16495 [Arhodomonas sp.]|nr:hypothetical protein [Arhodomonas sp.]
MCFWLSRRTGPFQWFNSRRPKPEVVPRRSSTGFWHWRVLPLNPSKDFTPLRRLWSDTSRHQLSVVYENLNTVTALGNYLGVPASRYRKQPAPPYSALRQRVKGDVSRYTAPGEGTGSDSDG